MIHTLRPIPIEELRLLIFDLDGTLIDSRVDLTNSVNAMLRHFGRPELPCEVISTYIGDGAPMLVRRALGDPDDQKFVNEALKYFLNYYKDHKLDFTYVYEGVREALEVIRDAHDGELKMAILSNKPVNPSRIIVQQLGLTEFFFQVYGGNSFPTKKPDPMGALELMREVSAEPGQTVIIGDSANDVLTGRAVGMWTVGLKYGLSPETLELAPPDVMLDHPKDLAELLAPNPQSRSGESAQNQSALR